MPPTLFSPLFCPNSLNWLSSSLSSSILFVSASQHSHSFSTCRPALENHYTTLGLKQGATAQQIKSQFYQLSKAHHPDLNPDHPGSADRFKRVSEAYSILSDPHSRTQYDRQLQSHSSASFTSPRHSTYADLSEQSCTTNSARRSRANYAWSTRPKNGGPFGGTNRADPLAGQQTGDFSQNLDRFERLARRRQRAGPHPSRPLPQSSTQAQSEPKVSSARQAAQLALMLSIICWVGSKLQI